ncbi:DoxX family protein [Solidesulfovibrio carbinoliphilus subsp. oakridgensis]|uniref:DoxX family protein n=1 Tax=Solidesulfovibrio carbinoliphilus subsp. oakridgensis TaxID=694327 RepID=G7Q4C9_9BACT|nr:MauE/DoxX family redox-associated membrane protein [Solidesulfovibrio carbinoliphilus]EHJ46997.1 DoxX family protein [Solidesulfovibrio carbinoliphilus subsp. oakridgensis]
MKILGVIARMVLGCIFLAAAWDKIVDPAAFAKIIRNYQILPDMLIYGVALVLPWIEVVVGMSLVTGFLSRGASLTACLMMAVFLSAMAWAWHKGISTQCGCFTTKAEDAISPATFFRDGSILALALLVAVDSFVRARRA